MARKPGQTDQERIAELEDGMHQIWELMQHYPGSVGVHAAANGRVQRKVSEYVPHSESPYR